MRAGSRAGSRAGFALPTEEMLQQYGGIVNDAAGGDADEDDDEDEEDEAEAEAAAAEAEIAELHERLVGVTSELVRPE